MHYKIKFLMAAAVLSFLLIINNCSNENGPPVGGEAVTVDLGSTGEISLHAHEAVSKTVSLQLFAIAPGDKPAVALMTLRSSDIAIASLPVAAAGTGIKAQQANGSVNIKFSVAAAQPGFFNSQPAPLAEYDLKVSPDKVALSHSSREVSSQAIDVLLKNNVTVTMEVKADFDAKLAIKQADLSFGPSTKTVSAAPGDEEIDNFFNNMDPTPDEPAPSVMAGCWQLRFVPLEASDGVVPEDPIFAYYEFNEAGGLQRLWKVVTEDEQFTINESYRFPPLQNEDAFIAQSVELVDGKSTAQLTQLESRTLLDEEAGTVTFGWLSELKGSVKLNASPDLSSDMRRIQGIKIRNASCVTDPLDSLVGEFELLDKTEIVTGTGDKSEKYKTITGAFTAFKIDCPDPSLPDVFSQEEQVTEDTDTSTTTTSRSTTTTSIGSGNLTAAECDCLKYITLRYEEPDYSGDNSGCICKIFADYAGPLDLSAVVYLSHRNALNINNGVPEKVDAWEDTQAHPFQYKYYTSKGQLSYSYIDQFGAILNDRRCDWIRSDPEKSGITFYNIEEQCNPVYTPY